MSIIITGLLLFVLLLLMGCTIFLPWIIVCWLIDRGTLPDEDWVITGAFLISVLVICMWLALLMCLGGA